LVVGRAVQEVHPFLALVALVERQERPSLGEQVAHPFRAWAALEALVERQVRPSLVAQAALPYRAWVALVADLAEQVVHPCLALEA